MHDFGQSAVTKLTDEMQMIRHNNCGIDDKSTLRMQPANRIEDNYCTILSAEDALSSGN